MITILGIAALVVSLWDKFAEPTFRPVRAIVFVSMGLSAVVPAAHLFFVDGIHFMFETASLHWLLLMAFFYLAGAAIYATRFPERLFPGKCDYVVCFLFLTCIYYIELNLVSISSTFPYLCCYCCIHPFSWNS